LLTTDRQLFRCHARDSDKHSFAWLQQRSFYGVQRKWHVLLFSIAVLHGVKRNDFPSTIRRAMHIEILATSLRFLCNTLRDMFVGNMKEECGLC
jgi:hypothetical protein